MNTSSSPLSSTPNAGTRALVLGGGGSAGNAWLIGVIAGLADAGLDITDADLIVGTSAGSTAAAQVTGDSPAALLAAILEAPALGGGGAGGAPAARPSRAPLGRGHLEQLRAAIAASGSIAELRRTMGAALEADTTMDSERWHDTVAARFRARSWPVRRMVVTAVDARTGEPVLFDRDSGVDLVDAVAASCAGGFAYAIGDRRFIDGGYRANADNADLAAGHQRVLVLSPLGGRSFHPAEWGTHLSTQVDALRGAGSRVVTVFPDDAATRAFGDNLMSPATRQPAARAGFDQGRRSAAELADFWG
jgi:NTE family protein